jgi:outer membrane lipoprotein-sorting protein
MRAQLIPERGRQEVTRSAFASILVLVAILGLSLTAGEARAHSFLQALHEMQRAYTRVDHYTATFLTQERLNGTLGQEHWIELKFRKPFQVYMRWITGPHEGRQALYPAGIDGNELWVRVRTLVGAVTVSLDPHGPRARKGSRHPITDVGIGRLMELLVSDVHRGLREEVLTIEDAGPRTTFDRPTHRYILRFPNSQGANYYCMVAVVDVDREHLLPIYAEIFDWSHRLIERYGYRDLWLNPGLTAKDFDPKNPAYGF